MEDQQPGSGDLTTDAELPAQPAEAELPAQPAEAELPAQPAGKASRRRHRMPLRQELAASRVDAEPTTTDEPDAQPKATDSEPAPRRRRWALLRRRAKSSEPEAVSEPSDEVADEAEAAKPAARVPVGKASRRAKPVTEDQSAESPESGEAADEPAEEQIMVPHRPAGKRVTLAAAAAGVVFIGAAAFSGAMLAPYLADRALVHTKLDIARTAANAITTLWTYTPDNMDKLPDRAAGFLAGDFANEYRKYIDAIVAPNKQAQVTNTTEVMGAAVESVTPNEATALVYTNSVATSPVSKNIPSLRYLSYRLTLQHHGSKWLITKMSTVTSFDLTPQL